MFAGLTQLDSNLNVRAERAEKWSTPDGGKTWKFKLAAQTHEKDYPISSANWAQCLESYRTHKPPSPLTASFPTWIGTESRGDDVILKFEKPFPFAPVEVAALRYFSTDHGSICEDPKENEALVLSGELDSEKPLTSLKPEVSLPLHLRRDTSRKFDFQFIQDENSRVLLLLRGSVDAAFNATMASKVRWLRSQKEKDFVITERDGTSISYLAFNFRQPLTQNLAVRRAIARAIPKEDISRYRMAGFTKPAVSFFNSALPNAPIAHGVSYDPAEARKILDEAGFPKKADGMRFQLTYLTTPVREGFETGLAIQAALKEVGIGLRLRVVEPSLFFSAIQGKDYNLFSSRWIGVQDETLWQLALHSQSPRNRIAYKSAEADQLIDRLMESLDAKDRRQLSQKLQVLFENELPYLPLWFWNNTLITQKNVDGVQAADLSLSGDYEPLLRLRRNGNL
jgi:peptide/nickel transport system substrate-binding protein